MLRRNYALKYLALLQGDNLLKYRWYIVLAKLLHWTKKDGGDLYLYLPPHFPFLPALTSSFDFGACVCMFEQVFEHSATLIFSNSDYSDLDKRCLISTQFNILTGILTRSLKELQQKHKKYIENNSISRVQFHARNAVQFWSSWPRPC